MSKNRFLVLVVALVLVPSHVESTCEDEEEDENDATTGYSRALRISLDRKIRLA